MSYIGNPIVSTDFPVDYKSGNGSTTAFTLSVAPASVNSIDVQISGVSQSPQTYSVSGTTLTFSAAPPTGTNNIVVRHLGIAGIPNIPAAGSVVPSSIGTGYSLWNLSGSDINYTAGNVGIGTVPSAWGSGWKAVQLPNGVSVGSHPSLPIAYLNANSYFDGSVNKYVANGYASRFIPEGNSGGFVWQIAPSGTAGNTVTYSSAMTLDASGNLLVGTTGIGGRGGFSIRPNLGGAGTYCRLVLNGNNADDLFYFQYQDTTVGRITITTNSTAYVTSSDYRLKENIAPMTGALSVVQQLKPVTYNWKADGSSGQGFIAHELQAVVPDCVTGEKDAVDAEGNPKYQGIDTSFLVATLTAAIQELKAELDATKAQLDESNLILTSVKTEVALLKAGA